MSRPQTRPGSASCPSWGRGPHWCSASPHVIHRQVAAAPSPHIGAPQPACSCHRVHRGLLALRVQGLVCLGDSRLPRPHRSSCPVAGLGSRNARRHWGEVDLVSQSVALREPPGLRVVAFAPLVTPGGQHCTEGLARSGQASGGDAHCGTRSGK